MGDLIQRWRVVQREGVDDSADVGQFYYADPGVFPAHDDFRGGVLYWARQ